MSITTPRFKTLFTDIGGVLLNNGWDRRKRAAAVEKFGLDAAEVDERHHLTFDTYEEGKLSLDEYLDRLVFYEKRNFTPQEFKDFMFKSSAAYPEMIDLYKSLKAKYGFHIAVVSNEGRELNDYRIKTFGLHTFVDFFISSSFVHLRKPDIDIFKLAIDIAQVNPDDVLYVDDRELFVQVAEKAGLHGLLHRNYEDTKDKLAEYGWE
ncbi:MAG: HAD-IA family hydrolase [Arachidicoccus sp.]|nr:HAD-IA family hydrolase [Arachidicoccus sp.]